MLGANDVINIIILTNFQMKHYFKLNFTVLRALMQIRPIYSNLEVNKCLKA